MMCGVVWHGVVWRVVEVGMLRAGGKVMGKREQDEVVGLDGG